MSIRNWFPALEIWMLLHAMNQRIEFNATILPLSIFIFLTKYCPIYYKLHKLIITNILIYQYNIMTFCNIKSMSLFLSCSLPSASHPQSMAAAASPSTLSTVTRAGRLPTTPPTRISKTKATPLTVPFHARPPWRRRSRPPSTPSTLRSLAAEESIPWRSISELHRWSSSSLPTQEAICCGCSANPTHNATPKTYLSFDPSRTSSYRTSPANPTNAPPPPVLHHETAATAVATGSGTATDLTASVSWQQKP